MGGVEQAHSIARAIDDFVDLCVGWYRNGQKKQSYGHSVQAAGNLGDPSGIKTLMLGSAYEFSPYSSRFI